MGQVERIFNMIMYLLEDSSKTAGGVLGIYSTLAGAEIAKLEYSIGKAKADKARDQKTNDPLYLPLWKFIQEYQDSTAIKEFELNVTLQGV